MVGTLNHWVNANYDKDDARKHYATWFRPMNKKINGDLPVLGLEDYNSVATSGDNRLLVKYGNLDDMLVTLNAAKDNTDNDIESSLLLYGNATDVSHAPTIIGNTKDAHPKVEVTVNEDAVLLLAAGAPDFKATVGITFDNSSRSAEDYFHNKLDYDWHLMSTPLKDAAIGATYDSSIPQWYGTPVSLTSITDSYFPNGLPAMAYNPEDVSWDFYSYYEPHYHWINLKRTQHWHIEEPHDYIPYTNETIFTPGKGYMMAISQDSYMNSTGTLNNGENNDGVITIDVTSKAPESVQGLSTDKGSNLLGNPYQAYLDLEAVQTHSTNDFLTGFWIYSNKEFFN